MNKRIKNNTICDTCGKLFHLKPSRLKRKFHFCCKEHTNHSLVAKGINKKSKNGNWNGGKIKTTRGYIKIVCKNHPRADRDGYVFEHILVAEKKLGRNLYKGEVVHHLNHIKSDNRAENIIIFSSQSEHIKEEHKNGRS